MEAERGGGHAESLPDGAVGGQPGYAARVAERASEPGAVAKGRSERAGDDLDRGPLLLEVDGGRPPTSQTLAVFGLTLGALALFLAAVVPDRSDLTRLAPAVYGATSRTAPVVTLLGLAAGVFFVALAIDQGRLGRRGRAALHERAVVLDKGVGPATVPWSSVRGHRLRDGFVQLDVARGWHSWLLTGHTIPLPSEADRERVLLLLDRLGVPCR